MMRWTLVRSASAVCGASTSIWIIVGTSSTSVTLCSLIAAATAAGANIGTITCVQPASMPASQRDVGQVEHRRGMQQPTRRG